MTSIGGWLDPADLIARHRGAERRSTLHRRLSALQFCDCNRSFIACGFARKAANTLVRVSGNHRIFLTILFRYGKDLIWAGVHAVAACLAFLDIDRNYIHHKTSVKILSGQMDGCRRQFAQLLDFHFNRTTFL